MIYYLLKYNEMIHFMIIYTNKYKSNDFVKIANFSHVKTTMVICPLIVRE